MQFGAFSYAYSTNIGDEIQTLSAIQFLPRVDVLIERDRLHWYRNDPSVFVIFNGWFTHQPSWPPPDSISPLFVAFYPAITESLVNRRYADYFKRYEPIGCRSLATVEAFHRIGVEAYFSACLTLTLQREPVERTEQIFAVDVEPSLYSQLVPDELKQSIVHLSHEGSPPDATLLTKAKSGAAHYGLRGLYKWDSQGLSDRSVLRGAAEKLNWVRHSHRVTRARELLRLYSSAKLVITSRLHCALPCLGLGTPVLLLRSGIESDPRFAGLRDLVRFHDDSERPVSINWRNPEPNSDAYLPYAKALRKKCEVAVTDVIKTDRALTRLRSGTAVFGAR